MHNLVYTVVDFILGICFVMFKTCHAVVPALSCAFIMTSLKSAMIEMTKCKVLSFSCFSVKTC